MPGRIARSQRDPIPVCAWPSPSEPSAASAARDALDMAGFDQEVCREPGLTAYLAFGL
ncbi:MAG: hypothetical protein V9G15_14035 [Dermatophilaceae bacterium]|nr:hypothetical protein [Actinomycetales bacterium]